MTLTEALDRLAAHLTDAQQKHDPIRDRGDALNRISKYVTKATADHNSGDQTNVDANFARRVAQIGGICIRTLIDLNITDAAGVEACPHCGK